MVSEVVAVVVVVGVVAVVAVVAVVVVIITVAAVPEPKNLIVLFVVVEIHTHNFHHHRNC